MSVAGKPTVMGSVRIHLRPVCPSIIVLCLACLCTNAQNVTPAPTVESLGPRPLSSYESLSRFNADSKFRLAATPVGQILLKLSTDETVPVCTGLVISPKYVLTARHCLEYRDQATNTWEILKPKAIFLLLDYLEYGKTATSVTLNVDPIEKGAGDLDYMVLRSDVTIPIAGRHVPVAGADPQPREDLYIIHHPFAQVLTLSRQYCQSTEKPEDGDYLRHVCDTQEGSSGAPVFNTDFELVGIHLAGGKSEQPGSSNVGLLLSRIVVHSPIVKAALTIYGKKEFVASTVQSDGQAALRYVLADGKTFVKNLNGWALSLTPPSKGGKVVHLLAQRSSDSDFVLWDPGNDVFYVVPKAGGNIKMRSAGEVAWSEMGVATKK